MRNGRCWSSRKCGWLITEQEGLELEMVEQQLEDLVEERSETRQKYEEEKLSAQVEEDLEQQVDFFFDPQTLRHRGGALSTVQLTRQLAI